MSISVQDIYTLGAFPRAARVPRRFRAAPGLREPAYCMTRCFEPGSRLFREGAAASEVFVILRGIVKLVRHLPNGRARIIGLHGPGAALGQPPCAQALSVHPHSAVSMAPVTVQWWGSTGLYHLRREQPESYIDLLERFHVQASQAGLWITEFSTGRTNSRVARLILFMEQIEAGLEAGEVELLTCQDMGEILGITPESVSRVVAGMKREGILAAVAGAGGERLRCDIRALQAIARD